MLGRFILFFLNPFTSNVSASLKCISCGPHVSGSCFLNPVWLSLTFNWYVYHWHLIRLVIWLGLSLSCCDFYLSCLVPFSSFSAFFWINKVFLRFHFYLRCWLFSCNYSFYFLVVALELILNIFKLSQSTFKWYNVFSYLL